MILHFDTETTGLNLHGVPSDDPRQPHIVSLSAVLDDDAGVTRRVLSVLITPQGYRLEDYPEAQKIHGITTAMANEYGIDMEGALDQFGDMLHNATLSAFNFHFDHKLLKIGCARYRTNALTTGADIREKIAARNSICTMESAAGFLIGKKRMSLKNAYFEMFKEEIQTGHHGSLEDAMASRRIFYELRKRGAPMEVKSLAEKEYATPYAAAV